MTEGRTTAAAIAPPESRREAYLRRLESTRLGRHLVAGGQMQAEHLERALAEQEVTGERLGTVLLRQGYVTEGQLAQALAAQIEVRTAYEAQAFEAVARQIVEEAAASEDAVADAEELRRSYLEQTRLGELFWQTGMVTREQLEEALRRQKETGKKIGEILVWMGTISDHALKIALGIQGRLRALATAVGVCALMAGERGRGTPVHRQEKARRPDLPRMGGLGHAGDHIYPGPDHFARPEQGPNVAGRILRAILLLRRGRQVPPPDALSR